ncbi:NUDIX hydrolase [Actinopolymorpha pittospori]
MTERARHSVSVAAVVVNDDERILVIRRADNGDWQLPGGVLELDETFDEGVRREVGEETGYDIQAERLTGVYKNMAHGIVALVFRAHLIGGDAKRSAESTQVEWWTADMVRDRMEEAFAVRILDALTNADVPSIRVHDGHKLAAS